MKNKVNRKNDCTVHFMVNQQEMDEINRRFNQTSYRTKREFYRDSILKNRIISIDLDGKIGNELRKLIKTRPFGTFKKAIQSYFQARE